MENKYFVIDYKYGEEPVKTVLFNWRDQQPEAEAFCARVKDKGGVVNIRTREIHIPD